MRSRVGAAIAALCLTLSACGGGGGSGGDGPAQGNPPGPAPQNSAPAFGALTFGTAEDTELTIRIPASDADGDAITFAQVTNPTLGSVTSLNTATGDLTYRPNPDAIGNDSFTVRATDAGGRATTGTVTITIVRINNAPNVSIGAVVTEQATPVTSRIMVEDPEGDAVTFTLTRAPGNGTVSDFAADGTFTYQPAPEFVGEDSFEVAVEDTQGGRTGFIVRITVTRADITYSGAQTQTIITESNAAQVSKHVSDNFSRLVALYEQGATRPTPTPPAVVDVEQPGATLGSAFITGTLDATGSGSLRVEYRGFSNGAATFNGVEIIDVDLPANSIRRTYKNTSLTIGDTTTIASGSLLRRLGPAFGFTLEGNIVFGFQDDSTVWVRDAQLGYSNVSLRRPLQSSLSTIRWTGTARLYDPTLGYTDVELDGGYHFLRAGNQRSNFTLPVGRGSIAATGAAQARLWVTPISLYTFGVELDLGARGRPEKALAFRKSDAFALPAGSDSSHVLQAAAAHPFDTVFAEIGTPFYPEGRFSEHRDGTFLTHRWYIDVAPPGSTAQLQLADTPRPSLTTDRSGQYLLRLEVGAGTTKSTDYLVMHSVPAGQSPDDSSLRIAERQIPGASDLVDVGTEVTLDSRRSYGSPTPDYRWSASGPEGAGSSVVVNAVASETVRFTPSQPGIYFANYHRADTTSLSFVSKTITVGTPRFAPQVRLAATVGMRPYALDFDGDGHDDLMSEVASPQPMILYRGRAGGGFEDGVAVDGLTPGSFWFEDLTGDGRVEVIRTYLQQGEFTVSVQLPNGQFAAPVALDNGGPVCPSGALWRVFGAIDIDRDGRDDLVRALFCPDGVNHRWIVNTSSATGFNAAQTIVLPGGLQMFEAAVGDVDGDGDKDLVGAPYVAGQPTSSLAIVTLNAGGTFDAVTMPLSEAYSATLFAVRDINVDGRADIFVSSNPTFIVTQNANGTFTESAKIAGYFTRVEGWNSIPIADLTDDGRPDLVLNSSVYVQQANGTFAAPVPYSGAGTTFIDINGDGRPDSIINQNTVKILAPR